jgi:hypothetical protein
MPEIGGNGGVFIDPDDEARAATILERLLTDKPYWSELSAAAIHNADRFRWELCSKPLYDLLSSDFTASERLVDTRWQASLAGVTSRPELVVQGKQAAAT